MSLRDSAVHGVIWTGIGTVGAGLLNFLLTMILARLLSPSDYGLLELLVIFTALSECFIDSGFSQAVIKDQHASQTDLSSVFFFNLTISLFLYAILFFCAPLIARFYHEPILADLSRFVFLVIIFNACSIIQNANFARNLKFRPQAMASLIAIVLSGTTSVILAFNGFGVWALAANLVLFAFLKMVFFWLLSDWCPSFQVSLISIKKYFSFGVNLLIQGLVDKFVTNLESLMIGRVYTKTDLGYFSQARKLDSYVAQTSISVIQKVTYPILAKLENDKVQLKAGYRRVLGITIFIMTPLLFFMAVNAENVLYVFFGPNWGQSTPYLRLWCLCGLLVASYSIFTNIFLVTNNTKQLLRLSLVRQAIRIVIIVLLIRISVLTLMWGIVAVTFISALMYCYFGGKLIDYRPVEVLKDVLPTIIVALIGAVGVWLTGLILPIQNVYVMFCLQFIVMVSLFLFGAFLFRIQAFEEVKEIMVSLLSKRNKNGNN